MMLKSKGFYSISLLLSAFLVFNTACYADINLISNASAGGGHGNNGKGHGNNRGNGRVNGHNHRNNAKVDKPVARVNNMRFSDRDTRAVTNYYSANRFPVATLPPGIAKNLLRGKPLPPGIEKVFLPSGLVSQLPVYPGYDYLAAGKDVLLVNSETNVVADILANVLR